MGTVSEALFCILSASCKRERLQGSELQRYLSVYKFS